METSKTKKRYSKIKYPETSRVYEREANMLARSFVDIVPCARCGHPRIVVFCCTTCGCSCGNQHTCECEGK